MVSRTPLVATLALFLTASLSAVAQAVTYTIPAGTVLHCRLTRTLSTKLNSQGDLFTATVSEPLVINGKEIIPAGATLQGHVSSIARPGRIRGVGKMQLAAEKIFLRNGTAYSISSVLLTVYGAEGAKVTGDEGMLQGPSSRKRDLKEVGIGLGGGGLLGTVFGGLHGTLVGGAVGGVAGFVDSLRRRGKDLTLPTGTQLNYEFTRPLMISR